MNDLPENTPGWVVVAANIAVIVALGLIAWMLKASGTGFMAGWLAGMAFLLLCLRLKNGEYP